MLIHCLWVAIGGMLGALLRYAVSQWLNQPHRLLPWGTLAVNLTGSFLLGSIAGTGWSDPWFLFLGTGLLGSFTTFSTLHSEAQQMDSLPRHLYLGLTYSPGLLAAFLGFRWS